MIREKRPRYFSGFPRQNIPDFSDVTVSGTLSSENVKSLQKNTPHGKGLISRTLKLSVAENPILERVTHLRRKGIWIDGVGPARFVGPRLYAFDLLSNGILQESVDCEVVDMHHLLTLEKELQAQV